MPDRIVTELQIAKTCPAPECNLSHQDIEQWVEELGDYVKLFEPAFRPCEQLEWGRVYLNGLLSNVPRKTSERMALELGENVRDLQHYIGQSRWQKEPVVVIHQRLIIEALGEEDSVLLIDESGVVKQGKDSLGVVLAAFSLAGLRAGALVGLQIESGIPRELGGMLIAMTILILANERAFKDLIKNVIDRFTRFNKRSSGSM